MIVSSEDGEAILLRCNRKRTRNWAACPPSAEKTWNHPAHRRRSALRPKRCGDGLLATQGDRSTADKPWAGSKRAVNAFFCGSCAFSRLKLDGFGHKKDTKKAQKKKNRYRGRGGANG